MSYVVALTDENQQDPKIGDEVIGAYIGKFPTKADAQQWIDSTDRPTYSSIIGEAPLVITTNRGRLQK
jgi:hypothetical protein